MNIIVFDLEGDGLYEDVTTLWCGCTKSSSRSDDYVFSNNDRGSIDIFINVLMEADVIVGHNILGYDLPVLDKLYGYKHKGVVLDTLVLSRLLNPERIGRHSIEAWGERFGVPKPKHEDWSKYSPEMLHRCREDVNINYRTLHHLLDEGKIQEEELCKLPTY